MAKSVECTETLSVYLILYASLENVHDNSLNWKMFLNDIGHRNDLIVIDLLQLWGKYWEREVLYPGSYYGIKGGIYEL